MRFIAIQYDWHEIHVIEIEAASWDNALYEVERSDCATVLFTEEEAEQLLAMLLDCLRPKLQVYFDELWRNIEAALDYEEDVGVLDAFRTLEDYILGVGG